MSRLWLQSLRQRTFSSPGPRRVPGKKARHFRGKSRLRLEVLEDRRMLATFSVTNLNDSGGGSLRQAIIDANSTGGADDIVFQSGLTGTIALTSGEMGITESVTITGNGATSSVIDAQQGSRIFNITNGDVTLNDLTLTNGRMASGFAVGGAILFASTGTLAVNQSVLSDNSATNSGGAIYGTDGSVMVNGSTLTGNSAVVTGGAIDSDELLIVTDSTLSQNSSSVGGAISANQVSALRSTFTENTAQISGGAIEAIEVTAEDSTFWMNSADVDGGAISVSGDAAIAQTTFLLNSAERGGAIYAMAGAVDVLQSTFLDNSSNSAMTVLSGNAIFSESAPLTILNSIVDSLPIGSRSDVQPSPDVGDAFVVEYSLIGKNIGTSLTPTGPTTPDANGNLIGDSSGISSGTGELGDYGGPTMTIRLLPSSPALNRGSNSIASLLTHDQRGEPFARVFGGTVDMGAFELQDVALVVDTNIDEDDGDYSMGDLSLREAIRLTSANPGADTIAFAPSTNGTDFDLTLGVMTISDTLTITGNGAANTVIDAQLSSAIFEVTSPPMTEPDLTVQGLSLVNGMSTGRHSAIASLSRGTLTLSDLVASGNTGGAVGHQGTLNVTRSTFSGNSGAYPLGANSGAAIFANGAITVTESTFSGNTDGASGGAIGGGSGEITVVQSTLTGNTAWQGGAIYGDSGAVTVTQSTVTENTATGFFDVFPALGGGIYSSSAPVAIRNSIVAGNTDGGTAPDVSPSPDPGDAFVVEFSLIGKNSGTSLTPTGPTTPDANGNLIGDAVGIAPLLAPLADNGGPTQTRALLTGSPAYNHGSNAIASPFMFDQRGPSFARVLAGTVDMGAFESTAADLHVTKTGTSTVPAGQDLSYTITVGNIGPNDGQDVVVSDMLPVGTTFVSLTQDSGPSFNVTTPAVGSGGTVQLDAAALASGASASFTLVVNVDSGVSGTVSNTAQITSTTLDPDTNNNASTVDTATYTTEVSIDAGGRLRIEDIAGGDSNDLLTLSYDLGAMEVIIVDPNNDLGGSVGTQVSPREIRVPLASIPGDKIIVLTYDGNDSLTVDLSMLDSGLCITYTAGNPITPPGDSLTMDLTGAATPVVIDPVGGSVIAGGQTFVQFSEVETLNLTDAGRSVAGDELYVRTTGNRERIVVSSWNDQGVSLRISDLTAGTSTTLAPHFGLDASGNQSLGKITIFAGAGDDLVSLASSVVDSNGDPIPAEFHGEEGDDYLTGANANDILVGGPGNDRLLGGEGDNHLFGDGNVLGADGIPVEGPTDGDDNVSGRNGQDVIFGGGGNDRLNGSGGDDYIHAGGGNDLVDGGLDDDVLVGADGNDNLSGGYGNDILLGGRGTDQVLGRQGDDVLLGGDDRDTVRGDSGNDLVAGGNASGVSDTTADVALRAIVAEWVANRPAVPSGLGSLQTDGVEDLLIGDLGADAFHAGTGDDPEDRVYDFRVGENDLLLP